MSIRPQVSIIVHGVAMRAHDPAEITLRCGRANSILKAGAGLDVFEHEPLPLESPLRRMPQVLLAAHNSNSSPQCWQRVHRNSVAMLFEELGLA